MLSLFKDVSRLSVIFVGCAGPRFGHQENFLAGFGIAAEKAAEAFFAHAVAIPLGRIPVGHAPVVGLPEQQLVVDRIEHAAQRKDRYLDPGFSQFPLGDGLSLALALFRGGHGPGRSRPVAAIPPSPTVLMKAATRQPVLCFPSLP